MRPINKITFFENRRRVTVLKEYKTWVKTYFNNLQMAGMYSFDGFVENQEAKVVRPKLNRNMHEVGKIIKACNLNFLAVYQEPPMRGGRNYRIDVLENIFRLPEMDFDEDHILDVLDRGIGKYESDYRSSLIRTFNPFFWIWLFIEFLVSIPFKLLGKVGFDQDEIEASKIGKIFKFLFYLISGFASFLAILQILGILNEFKAFLGL